MIRCPESRKNKPVTPGWWSSWIRGCSPESVSVRLHEEIETTQRKSPKGASHCTTRTTSEDERYLRTVSAASASAEQQSVKRDWPSRPRGYRGGDHSSSIARSTEVLTQNLSSSKDLARGSKQRQHRMPAGTAVAGLAVMSARQAAHRHPPQLPEATAGLSGQRCMYALLRNAKEGSGNESQA